MMAAATCNKKINISQLTHPKETLGETNIRLLGDSFSMDVGHIAIAQVGLQQHENEGDSKRNNRIQFQKAI